MKRTASRLAEVEQRVADRPPLASHGVMGDLVRQAKVYIRELEAVE